ncbi:MAG: glycosyltransferase family 2 protein [Spirochaetaceae bacterium]|jgi:glycosyltransferase involved in cell wall biosynthesis|nr:glycosyltransferase family 2 protein [Spirochaetaceae bacterium]
MSLKLIIQIPCYNEEETLPLTFRDLPKNIEGIDTIEYLIINDGSTDGTVETARGLGIHHIVNFRINRGLAYAFRAGIDACLRLGADIIVNTDADNQYSGDGIERLVRPILEERADIVIGERPIDDTGHFSWKKKKFQRLGSWVVRVASNTKIPDAPSGFRAYSREAAIQLNVINEYTYTLETIIQAGHHKMAITSVPVKTNPETRKSRLFKNMWAYMIRSAGVIFRSFLMYKPLKTFLFTGFTFLAAGLAIDLRFLILYISGDKNYHTPSLILAATFILIGIQTIIIGFIADLISANRKILEDIQKRVRTIEYKKDVSV